MNNVLEKTVDLLEYTIEENQKLTKENNILRGQNHDYESRLQILQANFDLYKRLLAEAESRNTKS